MTDFDRWFGMLAALHLAGVITMGTVLWVCG